MLLFIRYLIVFIFVLTGFTSSQVFGAENNAPYKRIISLYPAHSENLTALGLEQELIGIAVSDTYPPKILDKQRFSHHDNAEKFIAANPDLVLIRPMIEHSAPKLLEQLRRAGIVVISLQPRSVDEMFGYWQELGKLTGKDRAAQEMISSFKDNLKTNAKILQSIPITNRPKVYFESIHAKMKTFSPTSIALFVLDQAGGINIAVDAEARKNSNIAAYGKERILSHASEIDIFLAQKGRMNRVTKKDILQEPGFLAIKAIREQEVYLVDEQLVSRPTQRILKGIETVRNILYH